MLVFGCAPSTKMIARLHLRREARSETGALYQAEYRMCARDGRVPWFRDEATSSREFGWMHASDAGRALRHHRSQAAEPIATSAKMEAVGQLAGGIAHDFNNLLMVIQAHADRIRGTLPQTDPCSADAVEIHNATVRAASLTKHLLAFSRKQILQPMVLELTPVSGNEVGKMLERPDRREDHVAL